jgi:hypothetical protein
MLVLANLLHRVTQFGETQIPLLSLEAMASPRRQILFLVAKISQGVQCELAVAATRLRSIGATVMAFGDRVRGNSGVELTKSLHL